ncbi:MAG: hypothetical protein WBD93_15555, partial [Acidobacteriaceae bacterium]
MVTWYSGGTLSSDRIMISIFRFNDAGAGRTGVSVCCATHPAARIKAPQKSKNLLNKKNRLLGSKPTLLGSLPSLSQFTRRQASKPVKTG